MLSNQDLYSKHDELNKSKTETYEKIYTLCVNTIKAASKSGELICYFEIPKCCLGSLYPDINIPYCAEYIITKLESENKNIKTKFTDPNILFIDWRRDSDIPVLQKIYRK